MFGGRRSIVTSLGVAGPIRVKPSPSMTKDDPMSSTTKDREVMHSQD